MAPLNWDLINNISLDALADKEDVLYYELSNYDAKDDDDPEKLRRLFLVTKGVMQIKSMQAEVAMEEMVQMAEKQGISDAQREKKLLKQIDDLHQQIESHKSFDEKSIEKQLQTEIMDLEKENNILQKKLQESQEQIFALKEDFKKEQEYLKQLQKENNELKSDIEQYKEEISEGCQRIEQLQEVTENKSAETTKELSQKLYEKNQQINKLFDEVKKYEKENEILQQQITELHEKFEDAVQQIEKMTNEYIKIKEMFQQSQAAVDAIKKERDYYKNEVANYNQKGSFKDDSDDQILITVSKRVQEWKDILMKKEEEISHYQDLVKKLQSQMISYRLDGEHATVAILSKAVEEKDKQINSLKQQLARATRDIEECTEIIENLKHQLGSEKADSKNKKSNNVAILQNTLHETTNALELTQEMLAKVEEETKKKDRALNEALNRMRQYEMGQYGLADAVTEIKECKNMIRIRDKQIEDLIQQINLAEIEISDLSDENEFLRKKLGMDSEHFQKSSPQNYKSQKKKETELILSLQHTIENLEEERVQLRQQLYEKTKEKQKSKTKSSPLPSPKKKEDILQSSYHKDNMMLITELQNDNHKLKEAIENLTIENKQLQTGLTDISEFLKKIDEKKPTYNNEELGKIISEAIKNSTFTDKTDISKAEEEKTNLPNENDKTIAVIYPTSSDFKSDTAILNNHMLEVLKECKSLETIVVEADEKLQKADDQFLSNKHQIGLLYKQYLEEKSQYEAEKQKWMEEKREMEERKETDQIKLEEFQHLLDTLAQDEPEVRRRLAEIVRQMTTLRVSEAILNRKVLILQDIEIEIKKENNKLRQECTAIETSTSKKIGNLQRFKDMAKYKIKALISALEESVPLEEAEKINKQYMDLAIKYNNLLEKDLSISNMEKEQIQMINNWENENKTLLNLLENEKKRVHLLEETIKKGLAEGILKNSENSEIISLSEQLAAIEIKELHERQRADHIQQLYDQQKHVIQRLEERNNELEQNISKLMQDSLDRNGSSGKILENSTNDFENDKKKIKELEQSKMKLQLEVIKLKEIADVAYHQLKSIQRYKVSQDQELKVLQQQFFDLQSSSDEKMALGKLYRQILQLQLNEASITSQLETSKKKIMKIEAECLQITNRCENKEEAIYILHNRFLNKFHFLMKIIRELHCEYSGSISISKLEKIHDTIIHLRNEKSQILKDMENFNEKVEAAQLKQLELENKNRILEEELNAIKSNKISEKMFEWHKQIELLRLNELKLNREVKMKSQEISHRNTQISYLEKQLADLEEENIKLENKLEDKWLHWEETEIELEMQKKDLQKTIGEVSPLPQFEQLLSGRPDQSQSEKIQLEQAVNIIKVKQASLEENQEVIQTLKDNISQLEKKLQEAENAVLARDHAIAQLRSYVSIETSMERGLVSSVDHSETKQMLKTAQSTVACLQARLDQKEESLSRYKELLHKSQEEAETQKSNHQKELLAMWEKLQMQQDQAISTIRQVASKMINKPSNIIANKQVARLHQLEESVIDQEREILLLSEQLGTSQKEIDKWKEEVEIVRKQRDIDQKSIEQELKDNIQVLEEELNKKKNELKESEEIISKLQSELQNQKSIIKPVTNDKTISLYDNLKQELADKEKQLKALSKALTDLRSDMMVTVQDHLTLQKYGTVDDVTVQQILDTTTKEMQEKIKFYESQNSKLKRDLKVQTDKISVMEKEIQGFKEDLVRKLETTTKLRKENEMMQKKINKLKINLQEKKMLPIENNETSKLQKKVMTLEEQLKRLQQPEKPYDEIAKLTKSQEEIIRWEEGKKWQQTIERLKQRCQAKDEEIESLKKTEKLLRDQINRSDREKVILENRIKNIHQKLSAENNENIIKSPLYQDLQNKCIVLERKTIELQEKLEAEKNNFITLEETNKTLLNKIKESERNSSTFSNIEENYITSHYIEEKSKSEEEILRLKEENLELKLQLNQLHLDMPQLQNRTFTLQKCNSTVDEENVDSE